MRFTRRLYFAALGFTVLVAVGGYWWQFAALASSQGIWPLAQNYTSEDGLTLLAVSTSDGWLHALLALCCLSGVAMMAGFVPRAACLVLWACWSSLVRAGYPFLSFQWDILLVEAAFVSAFYAPGGLRFSRDEREAPRAFVFAMYVLAAKVTLESGLVKLMSGDESWRDLTALTWHWWTQPLPTFTAVWLAQLAMPLQKVLCGFMFVFELAFPLLVFGPRNARVTAAVGLIGFQLALAASGNFAFYNLLTAVLALPLLDDAALRRAPLLASPRFAWGGNALPLPAERGEGRGEGPRVQRLTWVWPVVFTVISVGMFMRVPALQWLRRYDVINSYGAFARMTKNRAEIVMEGSDDGAIWHAYEFPWKPGELTRRPDFVAPYQPRLDWQMWFASLGQCQHNPWLINTQEKLLRGSKEVGSLFSHNPFSEKPPRYLRTRQFEYRFAPWEEQGVWWTRTEVGAYCPALTLGDGARLQRAF